MKSAALSEEIQLQFFSGQWNITTATQLLKRITYGPTKEEINTFASLDINLAVDQILEPLSKPLPPLNYYNSLVRQVVKR